MAAAPHTLGTDFTQVRAQDEARSLLPPGKICQVSIGDLVWIALRSMKREEGSNYFNRAQKWVGAWLLPADVVIVEWYIEGQPFQRPLSPTSRRREESRNDQKCPTRGFLKKDPRDDYFRGLRHKKDADDHFC